MERLEIVRTMAEIDRLHGDDPEVSHSKADGLLRDVLLDIPEYKFLAEWFDSLNKWYS